MGEAHYTKSSLGDLTVQQFDANFVPFVRHEHRHYLDFKAVTNEPSAPQYLRFSNAGPDMYAFSPSVVSEVGAFYKTALERRQIYIDAMSVKDVAAAGAALAAQKRDIEMVAGFIEGYSKKLLQLQRLLAKGKVQTKPADSPMPDRDYRITAGPGNDPFDPRNLRGGMLTPHAMDEADRLALLEQQAAHGVDYIQQAKLSLHALKKEHELLIAHYNARK